MVTSEYSREAVASDSIEAGVSADGTSPMEMLQKLKPNVAPDTREAKSALHLACPDRISMAASEQDKSKEQKAAESEVESFQKDLGPFVVAAETTRMAMVFTDAKESNHPLIFANDSFLQLAGYSRKEVLGQSVDFLLGRPADPAALTQVEAAFAGSSESDFEICFHRKDGAMFWATVFVSPIRDKSDDVVQHFASFVDITKHIKEEEHLRYLLDELNHRTQNTLATVQAIAVQTLRGAANKEVVDAFEGRILALSKAHSLLGRKLWQSAGLRDVINQILQPFGLSSALSPSYITYGRTFSAGPIGREPLHSSPHIH